MLRTYRYEEIADDLRRRIRQGELGGHKLPSERVLMVRYAVQRNTVRRALSVLAAEGQIISSGTRGSFINSEAPPPGGQRVNRDITGTILVIAPSNEASNALESLLRGMTDSLAGSQLSLLYFDSRPRPGRTMNELPDAEYLSQNTVVGIVLWPQSPADTLALSGLRAIAPLVLIDRQVPGFETHSVVFDDFSGGRQVTEYLLNLGHRRIGFLTDDVFAETVQQRWRGYVDALETAGIVADPSCYALFQGMGSPSSSEQLRLLVAGGGQRLTAVVCTNDTVALHLVHYLRREGRRVPEDIVVTGFGNLLPMSTEVMGLTTVLQPFVEAGQAVGRILLAHVGTPDRSIADFEHVEIPVHLVVRGLTGRDERNPPQATERSSVVAVGNG